MTLEQWALFSTVAEVLLIAVSVFLILRELNQGREVAQAANATELTSQVISFNQTLWQDGEIADIWYSNGHSLSTETETRRYREMLVTWLLIHENVYFQHVKGLIDSDQYSGWHQDLQTTLESKNVELIGPEFAGQFPGSFGEHLKGLLSGKPLRQSEG